MLRFTSLLWIWRGEAAGRWYFVTVPDDICGEIKAHSLANRRGFGSVKVNARVADVVWRTSVFPLNSGGYLLPIKAEVRKRASLAAGDEIAVELELVL